jgi:hypothetical protein
MSAQIEIRPNTTPPQAAPAVVAEIAYDREVGEGREAVTVRTTVRVTLDAGLQATANIAEAARTSAAVNVLASDGSTLVARDVDLTAGTASVILTDPEVKTIVEGGQTLPAVGAVPTVTRSARFVPSGTLVPDYERSRLAVAVAATASELTAAGIDTLLNTGSGNFMTSTELTGTDLSVLAAVAWKPVHLAIDGSFTAEFPDSPAAGWMWWLTGQHQVLGFVADTLTEPRGPVVLTLPALTAPVGGAPIPVLGAPIVPIEVTESELVNNPGVFSEDPGAFCRPFSNPERILSEKAFSVIARTTQPAVGPKSSRRLRGIDVLQLEGDRLPVRQPVTDRPETGLIRRILRLAPAETPTSAAGLAVSRLDLLPHRYELLDRYGNIFDRLPGGRQDMDADHPIQWEDDIAQYQATEVAIGHILDFRVRWRSNGYSLGTVAKTLTLAPRQARRIQKIEWERSERAVRRERTSLDDDVNDSVVRERDYNDSVAANLDEWSRGGSSSSSAAAAGGIGFALPGVIGGFGGGAATANSSSHQEGGRSTTASETQRLRDAIRRHGDSLRRFESTVVQEVNQEETVIGTTEVIRNLNYEHSLTVIYYQILRHLKVSTEFGGVRQCLYVPFALRPFDIQRAYRWRESISAAIRTPRFGRALRYLKDVATNFSTSDIAPGPRANQLVSYLRGSIYVNLAVERPRDTATGGFDGALWAVAQPLLGTPALGIFNTLSALVAEQRDAYYQREHAPDMAARWADRMTLQLPNGRVLKADFTLASRYRFNQTVRIDFSIPSGELSGLRRSDLTQLRIVPGQGLPPGSVANLTRMSMTYNTARFERSVSAVLGTDDLVKPTTGLADSASALFPLDQWEQVDERLELIRSVQELVEHLNEHVEYYHKAIWWRMDRDRLLMMLDGFYVPGTNNVSIASIVDREPIAVIGNCLVYRVGAASFLPMGKVDTPQKLYDVYADKAPVADPLHISLPTDGLYAQTIMDECGALEEHYGSTDWALDDPDPALGELSPSLLTTRRAEPAALTPTPFPTSIINLQNAPEAPAPQGLAGVLAAVTNANAFRDMAGLAGTQANARAALETAAGLATNFGNQAAALELAKLAKAEQATKDADRKLASIKNAKDKGLTDEAEAAEQAKAAMAAMNPDAKPSDAPHTNKAINAAIDAAKSVPGSTIEAANTEGATKVTIGKDDDIRPLIIDMKTDGTSRAFGTKDDLSGVTKLSVRGKNLPSGSTLRWIVPPAATGRYTITQTTSAGTSEVTISGIQPGRTEIDVEAVDPAGVVVASMKLPLSIPQFITVDDQHADLTTFMTNNLLTAISDGILTEARLVTELLIHPAANVRVLWKSAGKAVPAHIPARLVTTAILRNTDTTAGKRRYGNTRPGPTSAVVGDTAFDESIEIYPQSYLIAGGPTSDVNTAVNDLVQVVAGLQASNPDTELWQIRVFGRLIGESLAHEMFHALLPVPFAHNVDGAGNEIATGDIMDAGSKRTFKERTGIIAASALPANLLDNLTDTGPGTINRLTGVNLTFAQTTYPVPGTPSF